MLPDIELFSRPVGAVVRYLSSRDVILGPSGNDDA
jgi:hypothetical protein